MAIEYRERDVSLILNKINAFWSSSLMEDRHIIDQVWRGYLKIADNLYTQLYQLNYAKSLETINYDWISHWERFEFTEDKRVDTFNPLYPYAYKLPENVKTVYLLRESPREISILPALTVVLENGVIITPDGGIRYPGDVVYKDNEIFAFTVNCSACDGTGYIDNNLCPICSGQGVVNGISSEYGIGVDTVKYYKRADSIADYEESIEPLGDFVVDEENKIIAFAKKPYEILWSEYVIRDTEIIYDNFGSLIKYYKKDSYTYWRQLQGLWYAYWHGSTIDNIRIGLNVISDLPFITDPGYVENILFIPNEFLTRYQIPVNFDLNDNQIEIPVLPPLDVNGKHILVISVKDKPQLILTEDVDFVIYSQYQDDGDYDNWYSFSSFNNINTIPDIDPHIYISLRNTTVTSQLEVGDELLIHFQDGSGSYIITVAGRDYVLSSDDTPEIVINQYLEKYAPLVENINVYDYINYPNWWVDLLNYGDVFEFARRYGRITFDSGIPADSGIPLDGFHENYAKKELLYYHTFLVNLTGAAVPRTLEGLKIIRAFLDTIKPSYSHYIIRLNIDFEDNAKCRDVFFALEAIYMFRSICGPIQCFDEWARDDPYTFEFDRTDLGIDLDGWASSDYETFSWQKIT